MAEAVSALPAEKRGSLYVAGGCALVGFGAKAGMFPLNIWLPKAHPVAPAPASALLSGILTKSGVFGVLILCRYLFWTELPWNTVVLALGVVTMVLGAVLALFSVDLKRTLACSSSSCWGRWSFLLWRRRYPRCLRRSAGPCTWPVDAHWWDLAPRPGCSP